MINIKAFVIARGFVNFALELTKTRYDNVNNTFHHDIENLISYIMAVSLMNTHANVFQLQQKHSETVENTFNTFISKSKVH